MIGSDYPRQPPQTAHAHLNELLQGKHMRVREVKMNSPENGAYKSYAAQRKNVWNGSLAPTISRNNKAGLEPS